MRPRPPRMAMVALVGLAAVAVAVGANLILIDRAPAVDPLGRLSPSVVTVDVRSRSAADDAPVAPPTTTGSETEMVPEPTETETVPEPTETEHDRTDTDDHGGDDHGGGDHDDDD